MGTKRYVIYREIGNGGCRSCGDVEWEYVGRTLDPELYQRARPTEFFRFKEIGTSGEVKITG